MRKAIFGFWTGKLEPFMTDKDWITLDEARVNFIKGGKREAFAEAALVTFN